MSATQKPVRLSKADDLSERKAQIESLKTEHAEIATKFHAKRREFEKVDEELGELKEVADDRDRATAEFGDLLFAAVNLGRHLDIDPEIALSRANDTFAERFRVVEQLARDKGRRLRDLDITELDRLWETAKAVVSTTQTGSSFTLTPERNDS